MLARSVRLIVSASSKRRLVAFIREHFQTIQNHKPQLLCNSSTDAAQIISPCLLFFCLVFLFVFFLLSSGVFLWRSPLAVPCLSVWGSFCFPGWRWGRAEGGADGWLGGLRQPGRWASLSRCCSCWLGSAAEGPRRPSPEARASPPW